MSFPQQQTIPSRGPTPLKEALPGPGPAHVFTVSTREEGLPGGADPLVCVWPQTPTHSCEPTLSLSSHFLTFLAVFF